MGQRSDKQEQAKYVVHSHCSLVWKQVSWKLLSTISDVFDCQKMHSHKIWLNLFQWAKRKQKI